MEWDLVSFVGMVVVVGSGIRLRGQAAQALEDNASTHGCDLS